MVRFYMKLQPFFGLTLHLISPISYNPSPVIIISGDRTMDRRITSWGDDYDVTPRDFSLKFAPLLSTGHSGRPLSLQLFMFF